MKKIQISEGKRPIGSTKNIKSPGPQQAHTAAGSHSSLMLVSVPERDCFIETMLTAAGVLEVITDHTREKGPQWYREQDCLK